MALVDHVGDIGRCATPLGVEDLVVYQKNFVEVNRTGGQVVVGIFAIIEVKST